MAYEDNGVVWKRTNGQLQEEDVGETHDEIWDDTALIEAYDKAVQKLKEEIATDDEKPIGKTEASSKSESKSKRHKIQCCWKIGQKCLALYSEDELWYEAVILDIYMKENVALVEFDWYHNKEEVSLTDLLPVEKKEEMEQATQGERGSFEEDGDDDASMTSSLPEEKSSKTVNWKVSDICYVADGKGNFDEAVINSFTSSSECFVTFIRDRACKRLKISALSSERPSTSGEARNSNRSQTPQHNTFSAQDFLKSTASSPFEIPRLHSSSQTGGGFPSSFHHQIQPMFGGLPPFPVFPNAQSGFGIGMNPQNYFTQRYNTTPAPPPPPPPVLTEEIVRGDEEALANMLMSWYMNGYHTGYYRGLQQNRSKESKKK